MASVTTCVVFLSLFCLECKEAALLRVQSCVYLPKRHNFVTVSKVIVLITCPATRTLNSYSEILTFTK